MFIRFKHWRDSHTISYSEEEVNAHKGAAFTFTNYIQKIIEQFPCF